MVNHVVLFKLKACPEKEKEAIRKELENLLLGLKDKIDVIRHLEVGLNYKSETKSYDIALISHFDSIEDLDKYRVHPEHLKVVGRIKETTSGRAAIDYEF
ncbi:MAG: Dabb family protein [Prolixibacteraceae bacterium]|nr:Dabb family protein [Prolixibacteraceae bacterium]MBN2774865.1 Dabb family protein [Prolixibacteraceae bacterium]